MSDGQAEAYEAAAAEHEDTPEEHADWVVGVENRLAESLLRVDDPALATRVIVEDSSYWTSLRNHVARLRAEVERLRGAADADLANQRAQLDHDGILDEFEAHVGSDLVEWLADTLVAARGALDMAHVASVELVRQRDEARALARVLAHAYEHDSRPPPHMVREALGFPVATGAGRTEP